MPQGKTDRQKFEQAAAREVEKFRKWRPPIDPAREMSGEEHQIRSYLEGRTPDGLPKDSLTGINQVITSGPQAGRYIAGRYRPSDNTTFLNEGRFSLANSDSSDTYAHEYGHFFDTQASVEDGGENGFWGPESILPKLDGEERADSFGHTLRQMAGGQKLVKGFEEYQQAIDMILEKLEIMGAERRAASRPPNGR